MDHDFDPMRWMGEMLSSGNRFHSVFLAPFSPSLESARQRFLADGSGPFAEIATALGKQGVPDPQTMARTMVQAAQGMCVVVIAHERSVSTVPQFFFGTFDAQAREAMVQALKDLPGVDAIPPALEVLAGRLATARWPDLMAGPAREAAEDAAGYWMELAAAICEGLDDGLGSLVGSSRERIADLAWWVSQGIIAARSGGSIDAEDLELVVRCQLLAGDAQAAGQGIDALVRSGEVDADGIVDLLHAFVDGACRSGQAVAASRWLGEAYGAWDAVLGGSYDLALAVVRLAIAAGHGPDVLLPAARRLAAIDRKSARGDLTREPIWEVLADGGDLLDTARAADLVGRSTTFIAKRLDQGTIPWCERDGQQRLPKRSLEAWKAVVDDLGLLQ